MTPDSQLYSLLHTPEQELEAPTTALTRHLRSLVTVHLPTQWPQNQQNPDQEPGSHQSL